MLPWIPEEPPVPPEQRSSSQSALRYEDVSQDGYLVVEALPNTIGRVWESLASRRAEALGDARGVRTARGHAVGIRSSDHEGARRTTAAPAPNRSFPRSLAHGASLGVAAAVAV